MPCYHLLPRAPIKALIVSFAYLFLYHVNFKPKAQLSGPYIAATKLLADISLFSFTALQLTALTPLGLVKYCLWQRLIVLVYSLLKGSTIKPVLWLVKASYLVLSLSGLMPCYHLLPRAPIKALIVSFAYLFLYHVNFKPKAKLSGPYMAATKLLADMSLFSFTALQLSALILSELSIVLLLLVAA